jgi:cell division protein FtsN
MLQGRAKQRVEIRVERRQLFLLFLVGLLVAALTFSLGVMTGKRLDALSGGGALKGGVAAADKAADLEKALKKEAAPAASPPAVHIPMAAKEAAEPKAAAKAPEVPDRPGKPEKPDKAVKEPAEKAEPDHAPKAAAKEKEKEPDKVASGPAVKEPRETAEAGGGAGEFTLQIAALDDRNQAVALAAQMEKKGFKTHISTAQVPGKGTKYRVRIGRFKTKEEADAFREDYLRKEKGPCFVTPAK